MGDEPSLTTIVKRKRKFMESVENELTRSSMGEGWNSMSGVAAHSTASDSSDPDSAPLPVVGAILSTSAPQQSTTLNESPVISKTNGVMAVASKIMDEMEFMTASCEKLLATNQAQSKDLETLQSTCSVQCIEIDSLKSLLVDKHEAESRAEYAEQQVKIAREKIAELETKLKSKEEEVAEVTNKLEEVGNSMMDRRKKIWNTFGRFNLRGVEYDNKETSKPEANVASQNLVEHENTFREQITALKKDLEETSQALKDMETRYTCLTEKHAVMNQELQDARKQSSSGLKDILNRETTLGIKRMGAINQKAFQIACSAKFPNEDCQKISAKSCSLWQQNVHDPKWHPFKTINVQGNLQEIVDEDDKKLKELRSEYGDVAFEAVCTALMEMNEYNPSGRYPVCEVWNRKEERKATMKEIMEYMIRQLKIHKAALRAKDIASEQRKASMNG